MKKSNSVVIVGGGLAGLTAAEEILKADPNACVTVLEAMSEVGGRTLSSKMQGVHYDLGAEWIGNPQKYAADLAARSGNETINQFHQGTKILQLKKNILPYQTNIPFNVGIVPLINLQIAMWQLDRMATKVPKDNPRECPHAMYWDSITLHTWIMQNIWFENVRKLFELSVRAIVGCETNQISFLFFLWYVHQNFGIDCLINIENGLQDKKFKHGTQHMSLFLKKEIQSRNGRVICSTFVEKIQQTDYFVKVWTRDGEKYEADYVILAMPPPVVKKIHFQPQLSRERRFICDRYCMGAYSKCVLLYDKHYWREKGLSGEVLTDGVDGPITMAFDDTRVKQNGQLQPGIVVFLAGAMDEQWTVNKEKLEKTITEKLAQYFKSPEMLNPIEVKTKVWNEEESIQGAPTGYTPPGVLTKISNLRAPEGRIHWAGTETARVSQGYMDGAIESGIRVSEEIMAKFNGAEKDEKQKVKPTSSWYSRIINAKPKWLSWI